MDMLFGILRTILRFALPSMVRLFNGEHKTDAKEKEQEA